MGWLVSREGRKWLYSVALAAVPLLVLYGAISQEAAPLWLGLIAAFLGAASPLMALSHLAPKEPVGDAPQDSIDIPKTLPADVALDVES